MPNLFRFWVSKEICSKNEPKMGEISAKSHFFSESDWANITITPSKEKKMSLISTIYPPVNLPKNEQSV
jgi:hypothetical protein